MARSLVPQLADAIVAIHLRAEHYSTIVTTEPANFTVLCGIIVIAKEVLVYSRLYLILKYRLDFLLTFKYDQETRFLLIAFSSAFTDWKRKVQKREWKEMMLLFPKRS